MSSAERIVFLQPRVEKIVPAPDRIGEDPAAFQNFVDAWKDKLVNGAAPNEVQVVEVRPFKSQSEIQKHLLNLVFWRNQAAALDNEVSRRWEENGGSPHPRLSEQSGFVGQLLDKHLVYQQIVGAMVLSRMDQSPKDLALPQQHTQQEPNHTIHSDRFSRPFWWKNKTEKMSLNTIGAIGLFLASEEANEFLNQSLYQIEATAKEWGISEASLAEALDMAANRVYLETNQAQVEPEPIIDPDTGVIDYPYGLDGVNLRADSKQGTGSTQLGRLAGEVLLQIVQIDEDGQNPYNSGEDKDKVWLQVRLDDGSLAWFHANTAGINRDINPLLFEAIDFATKFIPLSEQTRPERNYDLVTASILIEVGTGGPVESRYIEEALQEDRSTFLAELESTEGWKIGAGEELMVITVNNNADEGASWQHNLVGLVYDNQSLQISKLVTKNDQGDLLVVSVFGDLGWQYGNDGAFYLTLNQDRANLAVLDLETGEWTLHPQAPEWLQVRLEAEPGLWESLMAGEVTLGEIEPGRGEDIISEAHATEEQRDRALHLPPMIFNDHRNGTFTLLRVVPTDFEIFNYNGNPVGRLTYTFNSNGELVTNTVETPVIYNADTFARHTVLPADQFPIGRIVDLTVRILPSADPNDYLGSCTGIIGPADLDPEFCAQFVANMADPHVSSTNIQNHDFAATFLYSVIINPLDYSVPGN